jgi:hypothetical protein
MAATSSNASAALVRSKATTATRSLGPARRLGITKKCQAAKPKAADRRTTLIRMT